MAQLAFEFDAQDLYNLLVHYTDGECPLSGVVREVGVNPYLGRMVGILVESLEWESDKLLHLRYDGKRIASWTQGTDEPWTFAERNDTPHSQS